MNHPLFEHIIELTFSHRFSKNEGIGQFSTAVINNDKEVINEFIKSEISSQVDIDTNNDEKIFSNFSIAFCS